MAEQVQSCFKRYEKKYLLSRKQYEAMKRGMEAHMQPDAHPSYTICNLYYDTDDWQLIRTSLEKPVYKEKLRVRSYGQAIDSDKIFIEIKKKFDGVVYKRRIVMTAAEADKYLGQAPAGSRQAGSGEAAGQTISGEAADLTGTDLQISREIDWLRSRLPLKPKVYIAYDREAYAGIPGLENPELRITFDTGLRYRERGLDLRLPDRGLPLLKDDMVLMEIKIPGAAPMWLARLLSENSIRMTSFSKYGTYYTDVVIARLKAAEYRKFKAPRRPEETGGAEKKNGAAKEAGLGEAHGKEISSNVRYYA